MAYNLDKSGLSVSENYFYFIVCVQVHTMWFCKLIILVYASLKEC